MSAAEREELCERIAVSLEGPLTAEDSKWADLAEWRGEELRSGKVAGVTVEESMAKARRQLGL